MQQPVAIVLAKTVSCPADCLNALTSLIKIEATAAGELPICLWEGNLFDSTEYLICVQGGIETVKTVTLCLQQQFTCYGTSTDYTVQDRLACTVDKED